jgi:hypothetical protein
MGCGGVSREPLDRKEMEHEGKGVTAMTYAILKRGATRRDEWGPRPRAVPHGGRRKGVGQGSLGG